LVRVQKSHKLCRNEGKYKSTTCNAVKNLCTDFLNDQVNAPSRALTGDDVKIADFWATRFLPRCEEVTPVTGLPRLKPSTVRGYRQIWNQHLKKRVADLTLQTYEPEWGTRLLGSLTATQNKTTPKHIKALGAAIFKRAVKDRKRKMNPWKNVEMPDDAIAPAPTEDYKLDEAQDTVSALVDHVDAQLVLVLACFLGLGPAEIAGLQWGDIDEDRIHIRRNRVRGKVGSPKNATRATWVPIIDEVRVPLELWRAKSPDVSGEAWVIPDLPNLTNRVIKPHVSGKDNPAKMKTCIRCDVLPKVSGVTWKGLYAGRRGACTMVIEANDGNAGVAQRLLRHKTMDTTLRVYNKGITPQGFEDGMATFSLKVKALSR
jgi:integrase